jgi:hypothetical protein
MEKTQEIPEATDRPETAEIQVETAEVLLVEVLQVETAEIQEVAPAAKTPSPRPASTTRTKTATGVILPTPRSGDSC